MRYILLGVIAICSLAGGAVLGSSSIANSGGKGSLGWVYDLSNSIALSRAESVAASDPRAAIWTKFRQIKPEVVHAPGFRILPLSSPIELSEDPISISATRDLCDRLPKDEGTYQPRLLLFSQSYQDLLDGITEVPKIDSNDFGAATSDAKNVAFRTLYTDGYSSVSKPICNLAMIDSWRAQGLAAISGVGRGLPLSEIFTDIEEMPASLSDDGAPHYRAYLMRAGVLEFSRPGWFHGDFLQKVAENQNQFTIEPNLARATFGREGRLSLVPTLVYVFQPISQSDVSAADEARLEVALSHSDNAVINAGKIGFRITSGRITLQKRTTNRGDEQIIPGHVYAIAIGAQREP